MTAREQQVRALFRAALERPVAERASFVAELTGDDVELRRSVELLLSTHDPTDVGAHAAGSTTPSADLAAGTLVAHYRIDAVLGRGGMGVVYRGTDTKLNRPVALKFLAAAVPDVHVRRRFEQEAATTSGLNHPHIVTVFDVGEHEGQPYIVSELVDGGTLDEWAEQRRSRTWRQTVELMTGVADALAAAHAAGVMHRDVKPGNILIGNNGYAKLADFGLAKLVGGARERGEQPQASRNTRAGVVIGTVAYMSPEQAAAEPLDARSDIFSFGVVLYELLAGRRPFAADNDLEVLKSVAHANPAPLPETVPEPLRILVEKALEKVPADRYQTMQDVVVDLKRAIRKQTSAQPAGAAAADRRRMRALALASGVLALALVAALVPATSHLVEQPAAPNPQVRFQLSAPGLLGPGLAVAPNGEHIAYIARVDGEQRIWIRSLDSFVARALSGTEGAFGVFSSPDGSRLGFNAGGDLKTIEVAGGPANVVTDYSALVPFGGAWNEDGTILFTTPTPTGSYGIGRVAAMGGTPAIVHAPSDTPGIAATLAPRLLPDGERFLYVGGATPGADSLTVYAASVTSPERVALLDVDPGSIQNGIVPGVEYAGGFLLYRRNRTLLGQRFDAAALELLGEPVPLAEDVAEFAASASVLVYRTVSLETTALQAPSRRLVWFDRSGQRLDEVETPPRYRVPVLSPDGRSVAVSVGAPQTADVWTIDTRRGGRTRLTFDDASDDLVVWSTDSSRIVFNSGRDGVPGVPSSLYERAANGTGPDELLLAGDPRELLIPFDWSRDGRFILFARGGITTWQEQIDLWTLEMTGERTAAPLIESPFRKETAKFSPDGRWIAYSSNEGGDEPQIFVQPFPDVSRGKWLISTRGGREPRWRADGSELFYLDPAGTVMSVELRVDGDRLDPGQPQALFGLGFALPSLNEIPDYFYNVTGDGQRFLINEPVSTSSGAPSAETAAPGTLNVIINWATGLTAP